MMKAFYLLITMIIEWIMLLKVKIDQKQVGSGNLGKSLGRVG